VSTATSDITIMARATNISRSLFARIAVRPGDWNGMNRNFIGLRMAMKSPSEINAPQAMAMAS
jgi:hypothetical protein